MAPEPGTSWPVEVLHLLVSSAHAYAGRPADGPGEVVTDDRDEVEVVEGRGIVGDRYFGRRAHAAAAVTLFAVESLEHVSGVVGVPDLDPLLARRNLVLRGADVAALRGVEFELRTAAGSVRFAGRRPANPCAWMDVVYAPGAFRAMRGRGGLRCTPLTSGRLSRGPAVLDVGAPVSPAPR
ncbi:hypothetical protein CLV35_1235 [Motilibacter peucedani]|uniref:MOSC domain-containing protein n=1 Tax=Motilibacter peucedani TaxID=598650 RepID=A0A420XRL5_9ACTN|nr:molybdenum cofactor biosysynthesis protein [Motilibacter peucedani]RKS77546.1 hypothetical protein CLV35_1235 [Motilibacter peucedani]